MKITKSKFPFYYILGLGFLTIFDGLVMVLSFGNYTSQTTLKYVLNYHKKYVKNKKLEHNEIQTNK